MDAFDLKVVLGVSASVIGLVSYVPYFRNIFAGITKPHAFSWFVWGLLTAIAFFAQVRAGAGAGAWVTGITAIACFAIVVAAIRQAQWDITRSDWLSFIGALLGIVLWQVTSDPLLAVIVVTIVDALAFAPTFRKGYHKPYEETLSTFTLSSVKFVIGILALDALTVTTWLYPASLVVMNGAFVLLLLYRRRKIAPPLAAGLK